MASILRARGFDKVVNVRGGFEVLSKTSAPLTSFAEQQTML